MGFKRYWIEEFETMDRAALEKWQLDQLKQHLAFAYANAPYYREAFDRAGVRPSDLKGLPDLGRFPFTNKKIERDRQVAHPDLGDMVAVPEEEIVFVAASSGSTGVPTLSPFTRQDFEEFQDVQARLFWAAGMRPTDRYVHALNFTLFVGGPDVIGAQKLGALCIWAGAIPSDRLLFILKEFKPTVTWTTPSYAWYLGETARKQGIDPARDLAIRRIIVAGEPGGSIPATRNAIEELWDAEVYDFYGLSDIFGANAGMCEAKDGLHVAEDHTLIEVLDPETHEPVPEGEMGELVLTTLRKRARPMIRFRTGDIVKCVKERCSCGRTLARIYIHGRIDDMFIVSGVNVFPSDIEYVVRNIDGITGEYRIVVYTEEHLTRFDVEVERDPAAGRSEPEIAAEISERVKVRTGVRPRRVKVLEEGAIPRATHKAKRLVDLRKSNG
ncbi:MAG: phenylacetate--CoA ligase family protein [Candidatus Dadabacteria bacterium]|nr:MAG: phenylacetate--CoA ligase family protein [Candidatus Dadabacteria bacterium]